MQSFLRRIPRYAWIGGACAAAVVLLGVIMYVTTNKGTVKIELSDLNPDVQVRIDGNNITNSINMVFKLIPAGEFDMGSTREEVERLLAEAKQRNEPPWYTERLRLFEAPQRRVRITKPFHLGVHEVTQEQYEQVMGVNPSGFKGSRHPVEEVSWDQAVKFCDVLSALPEEKAAGRTYRLPTDAEWEYACRAGSTARYSYGDDAAGLGDHAWFGDNSSGTTHPVGEKQPNAWGLYDMHGNVWEWCADRYADRYGEYANTPVDDPTGPATGSSRVHRGGSWSNSASYCRTAFRNLNEPGSRGSYLGFRVVAVAVEPAVPAADHPPAAEPAVKPSPLPAPESTASQTDLMQADLTNSIGMRLVLIAAGEFQMGSPATEEGHQSDEQQHRVRITKSFHLGIHEVTQEQYERVMGGMNPSNFKGPQRPVEQVSWDDAVSFCNKLSALQAEKAAGRRYRLPTEAEWEYACRAGSTTRYAYGDDESALGDHGWFGANSSFTTHPVRQKRPNAWGLYDMHGNVWEWCADWYGDYYGESPLDDPTGPAPGSYRVDRGGGWGYSASSCRSALRSGLVPVHRSGDLGFRVAAVPSASK